MSSSSGRGEPFEGLGTQAQWTEKPWTTQASSRFEFEVFKPLARRYASFGIELCGQRVAFGEGQVQNLIKFLGISSQIAMDAQAAKQSETTPAVSDAGVEL